MDVFGPNQHGSTFGGNPLSCAVAREVVAMLRTGEWQQRASELGAHLRLRLESLDGAHVKEVRSRGLWAGIELAPGMPTGREVCMTWMGKGVLAKDTHGSTVRVAPPLTITEQELDHAIAMLAETLQG